MNYLLESTICIAIFYGLYLLIFSRLTFIRLNRIYLLASLILSLCIPLISYHKEETILIDEPMEETSANNFSTPLLLSKNLSQTHENLSAEMPFDWMTFLQILYVLGIVFMFGKLLIFVIKILKMSRLQNGKGYISTKGKWANSSFLHLIFIDDSELSHEEIEQIIAHEKWHIRLLHSYDLLFVEILKVAFWFNPILWFWQRSLSQVHEYEVDTRMIQTYNPQTYANLLLKLASTTQRFSMAHQFSRKPLTARIHFLFTKQKSTPMKRLAYLSILPILGVLFMAFSFEKVVKYQVVEKPDEKYFKIYKGKEPSRSSNVEVFNNKVVSNLHLGKNRISLVMNPKNISDANINEIAKYFKKYGFMFHFSITSYANPKKLDKYEIRLTDNEKNRSKTSKETFSNLPAKFSFYVPKNQDRKSIKVDTIITIFADRSTGEHFVAPLAPPPPPPVPPLPPPPPPAPVKGKTRLGMNNFEGKRGVEDLFFQSEKMKIPANMIAIKSGIYIEMGIVKNADYKSFLDYINQDKYFSKKYTKNMIPENWGNIKKMQNPVIYMSFEQGLAFCEWKTEIFTYQMASQKKADYATIVKENSKLSKKYKFRLLTENERQLMVKKGLEHRCGVACVLDLT
ncbi:MAG: M56 family metallopeptidase [Arcicella sp.]|nr:M56 family metallopeptidase [Arcicella sp.]